MRIEDINFENVKWPIDIRGWSNNDVNSLTKAIICLGIADRVSFNSDFVFIRGKRWSWKCIVCGHLWDKTSSRHMMSRSMNTCMRCGVYKAGPE